MRLRVTGLMIPNLGFIIPKMGIKKTSIKTKAPSPQGGGLADALFTKVQQRVLAVLFGNPDRSFYANELIALRDFSEQQRLSSQFRGIQLRTFRICRFAKVHDKILEDTKTHPC